MKLSRPTFLALAFGASLGVARWVFECFFIVPLVPDPQSPIWIMFSTFWSAFIAVAVTLLAWLAVRGLESRSLLLRGAAVLPCLLLLGWYSNGVMHLAEMRSALLDSADPDTDADRLRELAEFKNGQGYEIDNRVAGHPNTPPDVLRSLYGRPHQGGTEVVLAQNPNTPDDLLIAMSQRDDDRSEHILNALRQNPRYDEVFGVTDASAREAADPPAESTVVVARCLGDARDCTQQERVAATR